MRLPPSSLVAIAVAVCLAGGCGDSHKPGDAGARDAGPRDTGPRDAGPRDAGPDNACVVPADCAWGEIDHEILARTDCICIFGCPSLPQSRATVERRQRQHLALCDPTRDGMGNPCPIDDCIGPPPLDCVGNVCVPVAD